MLCVKVLDIVDVEQSALQRHVVALIDRHDVPSAARHIICVIALLRRAERGFGRNRVDQSVVFEPAFVDHIAALGGAGEFAERALL